MPQKPTKVWLEAHGLWGGPLAHEPGPWAAQGSVARAAQRPGLWAGGPAHRPWASRHTFEGFWCFLLGPLHLCDLDIMVSFYLAINLLISNSGHF